MYLYSKSAKKVQCYTSGNKSQVTMVSCINAIGQTLPLFVIFNTLKILTLIGQMERCLAYGLNGEWMDQYGSIQGMVYQHFLPNAGSSCHQLLLLDSHSSHYNLEAITFARQNEVIIFTLVPHITHEMQPLILLFLDL